MEMVALEMQQNFPMQYQYVLLSAEKCLLEDYSRHISLLNITLFLS